ncbi:uncharacterized protein LOC125522972 isoform X1 [Triticum urartu]|uniref:Uncharacterized protein n=1 Tax=Triticum urartu TaxID=4572 RepID=A0A8R7R2D9_TRIUA|nr:uncharacterized protein LOC125522972 isoform X1 [Triticum urartu]
MAQVVSFPCAVKEFDAGASASPTQIEGPCEIETRSYGGERQWIFRCNQSADLVSLRMWGRAWCRPPVTAAVGLATGPVSANGDMRVHLMVSQQPQKSGWNKLLRIGAATPSRAPHPNRITAFEKAVRCFTDYPSETVISPVLGTSFESLGEGWCKEHKVLPVSMSSSDKIFVG